MRLLLLCLLKRDGAEYIAFSQLYESQRNAEAKYLWCSDFKLKILLQAFYPCL